MEKFFKNKLTILDKWYIMYELDIVCGSNISIVVL